VPALLNGILVFERGGSLGHHLTVAGSAGLEVFLSSVRFREGLRAPDEVLVLNLLAWQELIGKIPLVALQAGDIKGHTESVLGLVQLVLRPQCDVLVRHHSVALLDVLAKGGLQLLISTGVGLGLDG